MAASYKDYLKSEYWEEIRMDVLARDGAMCRMCGHANWSNDVHHTIYDGGLWLRNSQSAPFRKLHHLVTLCRQCHDLMELFSDAQRDAGISGLDKMRHQLHMIRRWKKFLSDENFESIRSFIAWSFSDQDCHSHRQAHKS